MGHTKEKSITTWVIFLSGWTTIATL